MEVQSTKIAKTVLKNKEWGWTIRYHDFIKQIILRHCDIGMRKANRPMKSEKKITQTGSHVWKAWPITKMALQSNKRQLIGKWCWDSELSMKLDIPTSHHIKISCRWTVEVRNMKAIKVNMFNMALV